MERNREGQGMASVARARVLPLLLFLLFVSHLAPAQTGTRFPLWPETAPVGSGPTPKGTAFLTVYHPDRPNGAIVVICPGGGYGGLAKEPEGDGIARWLNRHNITGVVLEYRMPTGNHAVPLLDAQRALRWTRSQAKDWGCDPERIGIIGFSAGGHLASTAATHFDHGNSQAADPVERFGCRPNFTILIYPVITMGAWTHNGSKQNLLGPNPSPEIVKLFSNELQVTDQTPPAFLAHPRDDRVVPPENSRQFHRALREHGVASRYLELPRGDHGLNGYQGPMWDAWQIGTLRWLAELKIIPTTHADLPNNVDAGPRFPTFNTLATGPQQVRLLPGVGQFVFSLYGVPSDLAVVRQLVDTMRDRELGNGFDPGPGPGPGAQPILDELAANGWPVVFYSGGEMQIKGGRAVFGKEQADALAGMDRAGTFCAYQLGEWGYYFHNLSHNESWWRDVYGADYEAFKHLKKPAGLAGYDRLPTSRKECYEILKDYFDSRSRDLLSRVISVTGHSHYEAYAGEWGARCIGLEIGENIAFTQSKLAFARGSARAWSKPWSVQVSPWFGSSCTTRGELRTEGGIVRGLDAGHSLNFYERMWLHGWFAGTAMVTPENSIAIFFEKDAAPWPLTEHGRKAAEVFRLMNTRTRGVPYTPVAVVLDRYAGYNGYMDKPWGVLEPTPGDRECRDLFDLQLFPGSDHIHTQPDPNNPEASYLRPSPYGEIFDVLLSSAPPDILSSYPVILLAGDFEFHPAFLGELEKTLRRGNQVLMSQRHRDVLGADFERLSQQGAVEVLEAWTNPATGRPTAIGNPRLQALARDLLPFELTGNPVQYSINRTPTGWVVELINSTGVAKRGHQPAVLDSNAVIRVGVHGRVNASQVRSWRAGKDYGSTNRVDLELGPGAVEYIEWLDPRP
jgi:acetyl esterase/lipase